MHLAELRWDGGRAIPGAEIEKDLTYIHVCRYVCMHVYINIYIGMYISTAILKWIDGMWVTSGWLHNIYIYICICMYACVCIQVDLQIQMQR